MAHLGNALRAQIPCASAISAAAPELTYPSATSASVQTVYLLLPEWGEQARLFTNSKGEPNFVTTAAVAADMKVWLTDSDHGEFEVPTMVRVKAALDELYCEQLRYGTSLMPRARA